MPLHWLSGDSSPTSGAIDCISSKRQMVETSEENDGRFKEAKRQIVTEVEETLDVLGLTRIALARRMGVLPSAISQSLDLNKGIQMTTLVRIADALGCDIEINFIRRGNWPLNSDRSGFNGV